METSGGGMEHAGHPLLGYDDDIPEREHGDVVAEIVMIRT